MKLLLSALIWIAVGIGAISAVTAYFTPTNLDPELYRSETEGKSGPNGYLLSMDPAGPPVPRDGALVPMFPAGTELTPEVLAQMSEVQPSGEPLVKRVHVPEFSFGRWSHMWWFAGSITVMVACGLGQRALSRGGEVKKGQTDPVASMSAAIAELKSLRSDLSGLPTDEDRLDAIVSRVGELQQTQLAAFGDARDVLVSRHGLGRFAEVMDAFAGAERKINRAWSAAADRVLGESLASLDEGIPLLEEAQRRMQA